MGHDTPNRVLVALIVSTLTNHFHESTACADCFAMKRRGVRTAFFARRVAESDIMTPLGLEDAREQKVCMHHSEMDGSALI